MRGRLLALASALALSGLACAPLARGEIVHQRKSLYRNIVVEDVGTSRCMRFRIKGPDIPQSCMNRNAPDQLVLDYTRLATAALMLRAEDPRSILIIGMGGGVIPRMLHAALPAARVDVVEIDQAVVDVARDYFAFDMEPPIFAHVQDGRRFVKLAVKAGKTWDLVMLDAFTGDYIPEHMMTVEFLLEVKDIVAPGGVLVANTFSSSRLRDCESATYAAAFGSTLEVERADGNRLILARPGASPSLDDLRAGAARLRASLARYGVDADAVAGLARTAPPPPAGTRVLTDDWSPANVLRGK